MALKIPFGYSRSQKQVYHIHQLDKSYRGSKDFFCVGCNELLTVAFGDIVPPYFKHKPGGGCGGGIETALHVIGKQIITKNKNIYVSNIGYISYTDAYAEKYLDQRKPDVTTTYLEKKLYFEIKVTHAVDTKKKEFYEAGKHRCIEVDLSAFREKSYKEIEQAILWEPSIKSVVYWDTPDNRPPYRDLPARKAVNKSFLSRYWFELSLIGMAGAAAIYSIVKPKNK